MPMYLSTIYKNSYKKILQTKSTIYKKNQELNLSWRMERRIVALSHLFSFWLRWYLTKCASWLIINKNNIQGSVIANMYIVSLIPIADTAFIAPFFILFSLLFLSQLRFFLLWLHLLYNIVHDDILYNSFAHWDLDLFSSLKICKRWLWAFNFHFYNHYPKHRGSTIRPYCRTLTL